MPMATARPPRVMEFTLISNHRKTSTVMAKLSGIAINVINVVRTLKRKRKRTTANMMAPSRIASFRFPIALPMKSPCFKRISNSTPGKVGRNSASACSISRVSFRVSNPGALSMLSMTPMVGAASSGIPATNACFTAILASPRIGWTPETTEATSEMRMDRPLTCLITVDAMAFKSLVMARLRTIISRGPACR